MAFDEDESQDLKPLPGMPDDGDVDAGHGSGDMDAAAEPGSDRGGLALGDGSGEGDGGGVSGDASGPLSPMIGTPGAALNGADSPDDVEVGSASSKADLPDIELSPLRDESSGQPSILRRGVGTDIRPDLTDSDNGLPAMGFDEDGTSPEVAVVASDAPPVNERHDPFLNQSVGGYRLVELIGHGGMGMVYRGKQMSLNRDVAVKLLNKALVDNDEFIKRFKREAQAMASIHHPNIVSVIDFGEQDNLWYMVQEFVEGTNLAKLIRERVMVPAEELAPIVIQCLSGLAYVSKNAVVHRDIKPDNILIDSEGVAKIADFGLAKDFNSNDTDLTAVGSAMGTPAYMSPEQCMGRKLDVRSDIYSLGIACYYALTGEKPFQGQSSFEIMTKQREYMPPAPIKLNPQIPQAVSDLIMRMVAKAPKDRFIDGDEAREVWMDVAQAQGFIGNVSRSGEFMLSAGQLKALAQDQPGIAEAPGAAAVAYPDDVPLPLGAEAPAPPIPAAPGPSRLAPVVPNDAPHQERPRTETVADGREPRSERHAHHSTRQQKPRDSTSYRGGRTGGGGTGEFVTCPRCGHLQGAARPECERCGHLLRAGELEQSSPAEQLAEAQRALKRGNHRQAARLYGQLAEREKDRRQRSILRAKEREARTHVEEDQIKEAQDRSHRLIEQGDMRGAIKAIDRVLQESTSAAMSTRLQQHLDDLRRHDNRRKGRRRLLLLVILALIALAVASWWFQDQIMAYLRARDLLQCMVRWPGGI